MAIHNVKQGIQETCRLVEGTQTMMVKDCLMLLVCSTCKACKLPLAQQKLHDVLPSSWPRVMPPTYVHNKCDYCNLIQSGQNKYNYFHFLYGHLGTHVQNTTFISAVVIQKNFSHPSMTLNN